MSIHIGDIKLQCLSDASIILRRCLLRTPHCGMVFILDVVKTHIIVYANEYSHESISLLYDDFPGFMDVAQTLVKI